MGREPNLKVFKKNLYILSPDSTICLEILSRGLIFIYETKSLSMRINALKRMVVYQLGFKPTATTEPLHLKSSCWFLMVTLSMCLYLLDGSLSDLFRALVEREGLRTGAGLTVASSPPIWLAVILEASPPALVWAQSGLPLDDSLVIFCNRYIKEEKMTIMRGFPLYIVKYRNSLMFLDVP